MTTSENIAVNNIRSYHLVRNAIPSPFPLPFLAMGTTLYSQQPAFLAINVDMRHIQYQGETLPLPPGIR